MDNKNNTPNNPNSSEPVSTKWDILSDVAKESPEKPKNSEVTFPEEVLEMDFDERFNVDPAEFPAFNYHSVQGWNINKTLSTYVGLTAEMIATIDGTTNKTNNSEAYKPADCVVYLDKSARPVSWLVNTFWDVFSKAERPESKYLLIDRGDWFQRADVDIDAGYYIKGTNELARSSDFVKNMDNLPPDTYAKLRGLFIPEGIKDTNPDEIMNTPTGLEGKNILVVDEVGHSGSTLGIAKALLEKALPEAASIQTSYFWLPKDPNGKMSVPVWYSSDINEGRGIGELSERFFKDRHEKFDTDRTRAQAYGDIFLGSYVDLNKEHRAYYYGENPSRELASEIKKMKDEFLDGHIAFYPLNVHDYGISKTMDWLKRQGITTTPPNPGSTPPKNSLNYIKQVIHEN